MAALGDRGVEWDSELPGCFAAMAAPFGLHPNDEDRAFSCLVSLHERRIRWNATKAQIEAYLTFHGIRDGELTKQVERARVKLQSWLRD